MSDVRTPGVILPPDAIFGPMNPDGPGPTPAEVFEEWDVDDENPVELIGGWVLPMSPGNFKTGTLSGTLFALLLPLVRDRAWSMSEDSRHRFPRPRNTVLYPDISIHAVADVAYLPGTETIGRVPDLIVEILGRKTCERDMTPSGAKFLAYQMSGVREYYYTWPDGRDASGFALEEGVYKPLAADAEGFLRSPLLGQSLRLVPPALRTT